MQSVLVDLSSPEKVKSLVATLSGLEGDFELISGKYILDARSLMGIFSLDLSKPLPLKIYNDTPQTLAALAPYIAKTAK